MNLLALSSFIPEQICDITYFNGYRGERNIKHYCGYANDYISQVMEDDSIDGAVFPKSCDSSRIIGNYLESYKKFKYQLIIPSSNDEIAVNFFTEQLKSYRKALEERFGVLEDIATRAELINHLNTEIARYYESISKYSYADYLRAIHHKAFLSGDPGKNLLHEKPEIRKRTYLVGSTFIEEYVAEIIETYGLGIVGDNLPESGRKQGRLIDLETEDFYKSIAIEVLNRKSSPSQSRFKELIDRDLREMDNLQVDAVIFVTQKYCEPYDFLYSVYKKKLDEAGIPSLNLKLTGMDDRKNIELEVEAFAAII